MDLQDNFYRSRKFLLTIFSIIVLIVMTLLGIKYTAIIALFPTFIGGLLGILSLYFTGNIANKYVVGNISVIDEEIVEDQPEGEEE